MDSKIILVLQGEVEKVHGDGRGDACGTCTRAGTRESEVNAGGYGARARVGMAAFHAYNTPAQPSWSRSLKSAATTFRFALLLMRLVQHVEISLRRLPQPAARDIAHY